MILYMDHNTLEGEIPSLARCVCLWVQSRVQFRTISWSHEGNPEFDSIELFTPPTGCPVVSLAWDGIDGCKAEPMNIVCLAGLA